MYLESLRSNKTLRDARVFPSSFRSFMDRMLALGIKGECYGRIFER